MTRETRREVRAVLEEAQGLERPCGCEEYGRMKARLQRCALDGREYDRAVRALHETLGLLGEPQERKDRRWIA